MAEEHEVRRRTIGEMSADARILYDFIIKRLLKDKVDSIGYAELSAAIGGRDVRGDAHGILATARRNVEKDHEMLIETVRGEGIRQSRAVSGVLEQTVKHIGRVSRRASSRVVNAASHQEMTEQERVQVGVQLSVLGVIMQCSRAKAQKVLEAKVRANQAKELPTAETLRLFGAREEQ